MITELETNFKNIDKEFLPDKVVINMEGIKNLKISILQKLKNIAKEKDVFIYSLEAEMHVLLNLLDIDRYFHIFPNKESCHLNKYEIKNRKFRIV